MQEMEELQRKKTLANEWQQGEEGEIGKDMEGRGGKWSAGSHDGFNVANITCWILSAA